MSSNINYRQRVEEKYPIGKKFDLLTIEGYEKRHGMWFIVCRCDCGRISTRHKIDTWRLMNSCRKCKTYQNRIYGKASKIWKGVGEVPKYYYLATEQSAKIRNIPFNITIELMSELFEKQQHKCFYSGQELIFSSQKVKKSHGIEQTASLDRIDSSKPYEKGNLVWCHKHINKIKNTLAIIDFLDLCRDITVNRNLVFNPQPYILKIQPAEPTTIDQPIELKSGVKISYITLLERVQIPNKNGRSYTNYWKYKCVCGNEGLRREYTIKPELNMSCGCSTHLTQGNGMINPKWRGCGEIGRTFYLDIQHGAKTRNLEFALSIEQLWNLYVSQGGICPYLRIPIEFASRAEQKNGKIQTASPDRIDPSKGYIPDNVEWVHKTIQLMKKEFSKVDFLNWCEIVHNRRETILAHLPLLSQLL